MSSGRPSDVRSSAPERELELAALVRERGAALVDALDHHLPGARDHAEATASYAFVLAVELGHRRGAAELIREASRLHEIGRLYDGSARAGARLARGAGVPERACEWIADAAERFDGSGASGLAGAAIPVEARLIRAACVCDRTHADVAALRAEAGRQLDPQVVEALAVVLVRASRT